jgi:hypothetical protein
MPLVRQGNKPCPKDIVLSALAALRRLVSYHNYMIKLNI